MLNIKEGEKSRLIERQSGGFTWVSYAQHQMTLPERGAYFFTPQTKNDEVVFFQAFPDRLANSALNRQTLVGPVFNTRTRWIKTSFTWMMHRSLWATRKGQERILAITIPETVYINLLNWSGAEESEQDWVNKTSREQEVICQWDPDWVPVPGNLSGQRYGLRRTLHLGVRPTDFFDPVDPQNRDPYYPNYQEQIDPYIIQVADITSQVEEGRQLITTIDVKEHLWSRLKVPLETRFNIQ